jgi:adenosylcobinamide kinase / adenosylcobinamide-phosphate guanylyltransferase
LNLHLITGGARSGKSRLAQTLASGLGDSNVSFIATAQALDDEMHERIAKHRAERPASWQTIEMPRNVHLALQRAAHPVILLDCLTLLVTNAFLAHDDNYRAALDAVAKEVDLLLAAAARKQGTLIVVTNEVGMGIVPEYPLGRWFRDALGTANQRVARCAQTVTLLVSGVAVRIKV